MFRVIGIAATILASPAFAESDPTAAEHSRVSDVIANILYGIYCPEPPERLEEAPDTAAGVVNILPRVPEIQYVQTLVPAALGIGFGVVLEAQPGLIFDPVEVTITHPPYPDTGIEAEFWVTSIDSVSPSLIGFSFEMNSELVPGPWTFSASHDGAELFHVAFEVVPAAFLPDLTESCTGAFMS